MALGDLIQSLGVDPLTGQTNLASPDAVKRQRDLAAALGKEGMNYSPIQSPWQGAARLAAALSSGIDDWRANKTEAAGRASDAAQRSQLADLLSGQTATPAATPAPSSAMTGADATPTPAATFTPPADASSLPAGMRNNNPGNIKFTSTGAFPGVVGPSKNTDQGDPQAVFDTPESGMAAMYSLAKRKYDGGKTTPMDLIAGNMGWTPGNTSAAANVARTMGIGPNDDLNLNDPTSAQKFMRALMMQEHGKASSMYPDAMVASALSGSRSAPVQVASSDPQQAMALAGAQPTQENDPTAPPMPPVRPASLGGQGASAIAADSPEDVPAEGAAPVAGDAPTPAPAAAPAAVDPPKRARIQSLMAVMANPWASSATQQLAASILQKEVSSNAKQFSDPYKDANGNFVQRNTQTGEIKTINAAKEAADKTPSSVQEFEYAKKNGFGGSFQDWKQTGGGAASAPATVQEYNFYADQMKKSGGEPLSFLDYQKQKSAHFADGNYSPELVSSLVEQKAAGLPYPPGIARSMPGLIAAAESEFAKRYQGQDGATQIQQNKANQVGRSQEQRTLGSASASNTLYGNVASNTLGSLITASREVPRSSWVPINKLVQMGEGAISDPKLARFRTAIMTTANDYAKATTPTGQPTDSQRNHAYDILNTATGPEAVEAIADMMHNEIANTHRGINETKTQLQSGKHGDLPPINVPKGGPGVPGSQSVPLFGGGNSGPPPAAVEHLKSNPTPQMRQFFDQKFGPGSSGKILGGGVTL